MNFSFESSPPIIWGYGLRFLSFSYLLFLLQTLVIDFVIGSTSVSLDKLIFALFLAAASLLFFTPSFISILLAYFFGIPRRIQIIIGFISCWVTLWNFDFFLGGYIQHQWHGFLLVRDGVITTYGVIFTLLRCFN